MSFLISTGRLISASVSRSPCLKVKRASPSGKPFRSSARMMPPSLPSVVARSTFTERPPAALSAAARACGVGKTAADDRDGAAFGDAAEARHELRSAAEIDAVGQPDHFHVGGGRQQPADRRQRIGPLDRVWLRLQLREPHAGRGRRLHRDVAGGVAEGDQRHAAVVGFGAGEDVVGGAKPQIPACRGAEAVVDQEREGRRAARRRERRIPQRTGRGEDDQRRQQRAATASATTACATACLPSA